MNSEKDIVKRLIKQLQILTTFESGHAESPEFRKWYRDTCLVLEHIPGKGTAYREEFESISSVPVIPIVAGVSPGKSNDAKSYQDDVKQAKGLLQSIIDEIKEYGITPILSLPRQGREDIAENSQKHTYFLSYSRKNSSEADHLEVVLHRNNRTILRDETEIKAGGRVSKLIEAMIQQADTFVALWGKDYATSDWCPNELGYARNRQVKGQKPTRIVLLQLDDTEVPIRFVDSRHLAGQDRGQRELAINQLLKEE